MLKRNYSEKKEKHKLKYKYGIKIINNIKDIINLPIKNEKFTNQINIDNIVFKNPRLNKKLNKCQQHSNPNFLPNKKLFLKYSSIESHNKRSSFRQSLSNEHQTTDVTRKFGSTEKNINSNISSSYRLKSELKAITERNRKSEYKVRDINLFSDIFDNSFNKKNDEKDNNLNKNKSVKSVNKNLEENKNKLINSSFSEPSFSSYKHGNSFKHIQKDYYTSKIINNNIKSSRREKLLQNSFELFLHQNFLTKRIKKEYIDFPKDKQKIFSDIRRKPGIIAFGKLIPRESLIIKKPNKRYKINNPKKTLSQNYDIKDIFRKGFIKNNRIKKLKELKIIKDNYNIIDPNDKYYIPKDKSGKIIYPIYGQKKMLKNIMPKNYDYNTITSPLEFLNDTYHPILRFQKKLLSQHMNSLYQEIGNTYNKEFTIMDKSKIQEKYQLCQVDLQKNKKLIKLIRELINRNMNLKTEVSKTLDTKKKEKQRINKKDIYKRFREVMLKASIHFKRLSISLDDFYSIAKYIQESIDSDKKIKENQNLKQKNGQYFFKIIKANDIEEIIKFMKKNIFIMFYRDPFMQSPLHIIAKRNSYKLISLFISRGADINSRDEGGRTPLFIAAQNNYLEFITVLLFEIADPSIKNIKGEKAFDVSIDPKIKFILERAKVLHYLNNIGKIQNFNESIKNGLSFLYKEEIRINFESWLEENNEIIRLSQH